MYLNGNKIPDQFTWDIGQIADITGASTDTIRRNITKRKPGDKFFLKGRQDTPNGEYKVFTVDLEDYLKRTEVGYAPEQSEKAA